MKFIVMTSPAWGNNFIKELIVSGLIPEFIVTESPYTLSKTNDSKFPFKKSIKLLKFAKNRGELQKKYQPYFLSKKYGIPVIPSSKANSTYVEKKIKDLKIDYIFTFIFKILKPAIFSAPLKGSINFHPSDLPYNRGATPWNWLLEQNKSNTRITFHHISNGIDSGNIIKQYDIPLPSQINSSILREFLFNIGSLYFIKLIFELKYEALPLPQINNVAEGSYEVPFNRDHTKIHCHQSFERIASVINASRDLFYNASIEHKNQKFNVVNYVELPESRMKQFSLPHLDENENLLIKTSDDKIILLITNKTGLKIK